MHCSSVLAAVFLLIASNTCEAAVSVGRYLGEALAHVTPEDKELMKNARTKLLEQNIVGQRISWSNPKSGHSGEVSLIRTFKRDGLSCGQLGYITKAEQSRSFSFSFCLTAEGWKLAA